MKLKEAGAKRVLPLNVSGPFHSSLLEEAGEKLGEVLAQVEVHTPVIPYIANVTAGYVTDAGDVKPLLINRYPPPYAGNRASAGCWKTEWTHLLKSARAGH